MKLKKFLIYDIINKKNIKVDIEKYSNIEKNNYIAYFFIEKKKIAIIFFVVFNI